MAQRTSFFRLLAMTLALALCVGAAPVFAVANTGQNTGSGDPGALDSFAPQTDSGWATALPLVAFKAVTMNTAYIDANGNQQSVVATQIHDPTILLTDGWYFVMGEVDTVNLTVSGNAHVIILDGSSLSATATGDNAGIRVPHNNSLSVYGQALGTGTLTATGAGRGAGIGGNGGANGDDIYTGDDGEGCGTVKIVSAAVSANRIGGGDGGHGTASKAGGGMGGMGGAVTVYGGTLTVSGTIGGGIGGNTVYSYGGQGGLGGTLTVSGGVVTAGRIGGGNSGNGQSYASHTQKGGDGGTVVVTGGKLTAGVIGGGDCGQPGYVTSPGADGGSGAAITLSGGMVKVTSKVGGGKGTFDSANRAGSPGSCVITGGSIHLAGLVPTPTNGNANSNKALYATDVTLTGDTGQTAVAGVMADIAYNYGVRDVLTDTAGALRLWLPQNIETTQVHTASKIYAGSVLAGAAGTMAEQPADTTLPTVTSITPADKATEIPAAGSLVVAFDEMMNPSAGTLTLTGAGETAVTLSGSWSHSNRIFTASFSGLTLGVAYTVGIVNFADLAGNVMNPDTGRSFTVVPPVVLPKFDYIDENGTLQTVGATKIDGSFAGLTAGWYAVEGAVNVTNMTVTGSVHLILTDGAQLTATATGNNAGVRVTAGNALTIYGQTKGTGALTATGAGKGAGIGGTGGTDGTEHTSGADGGTLVLVGGKVTTGRIGGGAGGAGAGMSSGGSRGGSGGTLVVHGGSLTAAGIGGGNGGNGSYPSMGGDGGDGTAITIDGGVVNVSGKAGGGTAGTGASWPFGLTAKNGGAGSCVITGGSASFYSLQPTPTNGSANGGKKVVRAVVNLMGVAQETPVVTLVTDAGYAYGLKGLKTDATGKFYPWLPEGKSAFYVKTPDKSFTGAVVTGMTGRLQPINADTTPPMLLGTSPENGSSNLAVSGKIAVNFSETMDGLSGGVTLSAPGEADALLNGVWSVQNKTYTAEYSYLNTLTTYTATINGFKDAAGNAVAQSTVLTFATGSDPGPMPGSGSGGGGGTGGNDAGDSPQEQNTPFAGTPAAGVFGTPAFIAPNAGDGALASQMTVLAQAAPNGTLQAQLGAQGIDDAIASAAQAGGVVQAAVETPAGSRALSASLPQNTLLKLADSDIAGFAITGGPVDLSLNARALQVVGQQSTGGQAVVFDMRPAENTPGTGVDLIGNRPVYSVTIGVKGDAGNIPVKHLGGGRIILAIPYTPGMGETPNALVGVYVDENGRAQPVQESYYDALRKQLIISAGHLSTFGVGYQPLASVTDIKNHPAQNAILFAIGRNLLTLNKGAFQPDAPLTREALAAALGRLAGAGTSSAQATVPTDVAHDSLSAPVISWVLQNRVMQTDKAGRFLPKAPVAREDLAVIIQRFAEAAGIHLPKVRNPVDFADAALISPGAQAAVAAMQQAGLTMGVANGRFDPASPATRAQTAALLQRLVMRSIDAATAQGWDQDDVGYYFFYQNGAPLTGRHEILGTEFVFYADGTLHNGWQSDAAGNRYFIWGNRALTGTWDIAVENGLWRCSFDEKGRLISREAKKE